MKPYYQDKWVTIYHGDCREIVPQLGKVDLVLTDPPYDIDPQGGGLGSKRQYLKDIYKQNLHIGFDYHLLDMFVAKLVLPNMMFFSNTRQLHGYIDWIEANKLRFNLLCWHKVNPIPLSNHNYLPDTEYVVHCWKGDVLQKGNHGKWILCSGDSSIHPTAKPIAVVAKLIIPATEPNDLILDPFLGSGTTCFCAKKLHRYSIGIEIEEKYCEVAARRCCQEVMGFNG